MYKILITGVTGFAGSSLVTYFNSVSDVKVYGHSRDSVNAREKYKGFSIEIIEEYSIEVLDNLNIDCVIHLAGIAHDLSNKYVDQDYYRVNFENTARLYDQFLQSKARLFIYFSSIKAAVDSIDRSLDEEVVPNPVTAYGKSKLKAEDYLATNTSPSKTFLILRPCMIHGPQNKGNLNLLYKFVKLGLPYPLGAFQNRRSFLNADNLNFIIDNCIRKPLASGIYNLADEGALSTNEVVENIAATLGKKPKIWWIPKSLVGIMFSLTGRRKMLAKLTEDMVVSNNKILSGLNISLPVSIEEGLRRTIKSFHD